jgi:hypothetical protein
MSIGDVDRAPARVNTRHAAQRQSALAQIGGDDFPVIHTTCAILAVDEKCREQLRGQREINP